VKRQTLEIVEPVIGPAPLAHPGDACSARHFSPAIVVLIDPDALAVGDLIQEPRGDDFSRRIFQAFDFVEQTVIHLTQQRVHQNVNLFEIAHEPARIERATHCDRDPVIVAMQIAASMTLGNKRKMMSRFKPIGSTDPCLLRCVMENAPFIGCGIRGERSCRNGSVHGIPISLCV
jgi:hypothetical protein